MKTPFLKAAWAVALKDMQAEFRSREMLSLMAIFALLSVLIFSFALELNLTARSESISGVLWVTVAFAAIIGLNRTSAIEREGGGIDAMLIAPIDRTSVFMGKLIGTYFFALIVGAILVPVAALLYNLPLFKVWLIPTLLLGTLGLCVVGTMLSTMTVQTRARESLLPVVMLPLALPIVLAAVKATTGILTDGNFEDWSAWLGILALINGVYLAACLVMFDFVVEE